MYYVYMLRCNDGSLYTGITNHLQRRLSTHNRGKASRYTRSRLPVTITYVEECETKSEALRREYALKNKKKAEKESLILDHLGMPYK